MNYKLKHLSRFFCKPETPEAFELVRLSAEIGGVEFDCAFVGGYYYFITNDGWRISSKDSPSVSRSSIITVLDFCRKLRMTEEEAEKLEDDRVASDVGHNWEITDGAKVFKAINGHYFKTNDDGTEVTLHKR